VFLLVLPFLSSFSPCVPFHCNPRENDAHFVPERPDSLHDRYKAAMCLQATISKVIFSLTGELIFISDTVLLFEPIFRPVLDYAYPICTSAAQSRLEAARATFKCPPIATNALSYFNNKHIQKDLEFLLCADHIRPLTQSFDSKVSRCGRPHSSVNWKVLAPPKASGTYLNTQRRQKLGRPVDVACSKAAKPAQIFS
jgi:hypothetical protein